MPQELKVWAQLNYNTTYTEADFQAMKQNLEDVEKELPKRTGGFLDLKSSV